MPFSIANAAGQQECLYNAMRFGTPDAGHYAGVYNDEPCLFMFSLECYVDALFPGMHEELSVHC